MLNLQFNVSGSWRNVVSFEEARLEEAVKAATVLLSAAGRGTMRVIDESNEVVLHWDDAGRRDWPFGKPAAGKRPNRSK